MQRPGFLVKNAPDVGGNLDIAEPDAGDFNLLGNNRFGVISGCDVTVSGASWNVTVAPGIVVVNGMLASTGGVVTLPLSSQDARFDLIAITSAGAVSSIQGTPSPNPVFPDLPPDMTVIAAIMIRPGQTPPLQSDVTDKRIMLADRFITAINGTGLIISSNDPANVHQAKYTVQHDGKTVWQSDTILERESPATLLVTDNLHVKRVLHAEDGQFDDDVTVGGDLVSADFQKAAGPPTVPGQPGFIYRDSTTGAVYTWVVPGGWVQLSAVPIPAGAVMPSMSGVQPTGWLILNGQIVTQAQAGGLWNLFPSWQTDASHLQVPDMTGRVPLGGAPGQQGGAASMLLTTDHLPPHKHLTSPSGSAPAGSHTHTVNIAPSGSHNHATDPNAGTHNHNITDPQHQHVGVDGGNGTFVHTYWGGRNKLDGYFNDASHTYSVEAMMPTAKALTGVQVVPGQGSHGHVTDTAAAHSHVATADPSGATHTHAIPEATVGSGVPFSLLPPYFSVVWMIKT